MAFHCFFFLFKFRSLTHLNGRLEISALYNYTCYWFEWILKCGSHRQTATRSTIMLLLLLILLWFFQNDFCFVHFNVLCLFWFCSSHSMPFVRLFSAFIHFRLSDKAQNALFFAIDWKEYLRICIACTVLIITFEREFWMNCPRFCCCYCRRFDTRSFVCCLLFLSFCAFRIWIRV